MTQITNVTWTMWWHQRSTSVRTVAATSASGTILSTPPSLTDWPGMPRTTLVFSSYAGAIRFTFD
jgi:hypothetical protein